MGNEQGKVVENHRYPSGNVYSGGMKGSKRHGQGTLRWADGAVYSGGWEDDQCSGAGRMQFPNGSVYEGRFVRNNPYGDGKLTTVNGEVLMGFFEFHGRSDQTNTPVGKYQFRGELIDVKTGTRTIYNGPLALYLLSGLVTLPGMQDPMGSLLPYAVVAGSSSLGAEGKELFNEALDSKDTVSPPVAQVIATAATSSSSIQYGQQEQAFQARHPDDHAAVSLLDPRLYLAGLGVPVNPANTNARRQAEIRAQQAANQETPIATAVPLNTNPPYVFH